jgi:hypothetical protein
MRARLVSRESTHYIRVSTEGTTTFKIRTSKERTEKKDKLSNRALSGGTQEERRAPKRTEQNRNKLFSPAMI